MAQTAQRARGDRLRAVGQLEQRGDLEERNRRADDRALVGERGRDRAGRGDECRGEHRHHDPTDAEADQAASARECEVAGADRAPDAHRCRARDPDRARERRARDVERDRVRCGRARAEVRCDHRRDSEDPDLGEDLPARRDAVARDQPEVGAGRRRARTGAVDRAQRGGVHRDRQDLYRRRRERGAEHAEVCAVDQREVEHGVDDVARDHRDDQRARAAVRGQVRTQRDRDEERHDADRACVDVHARLADDLGRDVGGAQHERRREHDERRDEADQHGKSHAGADRAAGVVGAAGAERLRHDGVHAHDDAHADRGDREQ